MHPAKPVQAKYDVKITVINQQEIRDKLLATYNYGTFRAHLIA